MLFRERLFTLPVSRVGYRAHWDNGVVGGCFRGVDVLKHCRVRGVSERLPTF